VALQEFIGYNESEIFPYLMVSCGSGVSILLVKGDDDYERVSGSAIGGGTTLTPSLPSPPKATECTTTQRARPWPHALCWTATFYGLCRMLTGLETFEDIQLSGFSGNHENIDLLV
jgi:type II pantothenate kinase